MEIKGASIIGVYLNKELTAFVEDYASKKGISTGKAIQEIVYTYFREGAKNGGKRRKA